MTIETTFGPFDVGMGTPRCGRVGLGWRLWLGLAAVISCLAGSATYAGAQGGGIQTPKQGVPRGGAWSADVQQAGPGQSDTKPKAVSWLMSGDGVRTEVRIEITRQVAANMFLLDEPYRAIIDVPDLTFRLPATAGARGRGLVKSFRYGQFGAGRARIVIDLSAPAKVENARFTAPANGANGVLSFELVAVSAADFAALLGAAPPAAPPAEVASLRGGRHDAADMHADTRAAKTPSAGRRARPVVLIDPGHGGLDPGTVASASITEKAVTLAVALQVRSLLAQGRKVDAHLTRHNDTFVSLDQRVKLARTLQADLFVSIHADSLAEKEFAQAISGATVYTLSDRASDERSRRMAEKENSADVLAGLANVPASAEEQVRNILLDLVERETANNSLMFRNVLLRQMQGKVPLAKDPQRSAAFKVLRQAETPAVLVELGYMSNAGDLARLLKPEGQRQLAASIAASIEAYFAQQSKTRVP